MVTARCLTRGEVGTEVDKVDLVPTRRVSVLAVFSWRRLEVNQAWRGFRQLRREVRREEEREVWLGGVGVAMKSNVVCQKTCPM